jgi:hypothetical protein
MDSILKSFKLQKHLNPEIWENAETDDFDQIKLQSDVRSALLNIAKDFVDSFNIETLEIDDVVIIGSLVNYNWSKYSDIDLHIVFDKNSLKSDQKVVDELFDAKKENYNEKRNITVKGYDIELYAQGIGEEKDSLGKYSVLYNKWEDVPDKENFELNKKLIISKVKGFDKELKTVEKMEDSDAKINKINKLKDKVKNYRQSGLNKEGEFSNENIVFKYLRRSGFMGRLNDIKNNAKDAVLTIENTEL